MSYNTELLDVIGALNALEVPYMVTGSIATNLHGIPRLSQDADFVVQVASGKGIREIVSRLGEGYKLDPQATFESITGSLRYRLQAKETGFKIELFLLMDEEFDQLRFSQKQEVVLDDVRFFIPTLNDHLINKVWWGYVAKRKKDLFDIENLLKVRGNDMDWPYIEQWCTRQGTMGYLNEIRRGLNGSTS